MWFSCLNNLHLVTAKTTQTLVSWLYTFDGFLLMTGYFGSLGFLVVEKERRLEKGDHWRGWWEGSVKKRGKHRCGIETLERRNQNEWLLWLLFGGYITGEREEKKKLKDWITKEEIIAIISFHWNKLKTSFFFALLVYFDNFESPNELSLILHSFLAILYKHLLFIIITLAVHMLPKKLLFLFNSVSKLFIIFILSTSTLFFAENTDICRKKSRKKSEKA